MNELRNVSKMTGAERQVELALEGKRRSENCGIDIQNALKKWNCVLTPFVTISGRGIVNSGYEIMPQMEVKLQ